jgi:hypothetical protein
MHLTWAMHLTSQPRRKDGVHQNSLEKLGYKLVSYHLQICFKGKTFPHARVSNLEPEERQETMMQKSYYYMPSPQTNKPSERVIVVVIGQRDQDYPYLQLRLILQVDAQALLQALALAVAVEALSADASSV